jgi:hypothetical protein
MTDIEVEVAEAPVKTETKPQTIEDLVRASRALIPVVPRVGADPAQFQAMIDFAKTMSQDPSLPEHLRGHTGTCLRCVNISMRSGLDPWAIGELTYVAKGRFCMMSQLYHAMLMTSGYLKGTLEHIFEGEGDEMTCTIIGYLKADPDKPKEWKSPPLGVRRKWNANSPLWQPGAKPMLQLFYDTSRDWVKRHCPQANLGGSVAEDEIDEYPERDVTPLSERLAATDRPQTGEGFRRGEHLAEELARISPNEGLRARVEPDEGLSAALSGMGEEAEPEAPEPTEAQPAARSAPLRGLDRLKRFRGREQPEARQQAAKVRRGHMPTKEEVRRAADRAERRGAPPKPTKPVPELSAYGRQALEWIEKVTSVGDALDRWDHERPLRGEFKVSLKERKWLEDRLADACKSLRG